jgi:branched-chain amino acid transport system permease protein
VSDRTSRTRIVRLLSLALVAVLLLLLPLYLDGSWLIVGILAMAAAVGAIGLTILVGTAGQLSLAHAFFLAVGAYSYAYLAGEPSDSGVSGLGWPTIIAAVAAVLIAAVAGLAFSPVAARVRGLYLGVASLGLVFIGQHLLQNLTPVTGGTNGREVAPLDLFGFELTGSQPDFALFGVPLEGRERMWYLMLVALLFAMYFASGVVRGRPGRALTMIRDNQAAASALGIPVQRYKASAFVLSSAFAGASGVLTALAFGYVVPQYFGLALSINFLVMVLIGGLGSIAGAVAGAVVVTAFPLVLDRLTAGTDFLAPAGSGGYDASTVSAIVFGVLVIVIIILEPGGLAQLVRRIVAAIRRGRRGATKIPGAASVSEQAPANPESALHERTHSATQ